MNTYLKYQPPFIHFLTFLALAGGFFFIDYLISSYFFSDISAVLFDKSVVVTPEMLAQFKWAQLTSAIMSFIVPSLLLGYYSSEHSMKYIGLQKTISPVLVFSAIVFILAVQPFVMWLGVLNANINFGSLQKTLKDLEALYERAMNIFLKMDTPKDLVINLFIMALLPAIGEELFFRGSLQKVLLRLTNKPAIAIIASSAVFAILHNTYFKIIPIFTLGLFLGTIYYFTRNLWYTIIIHFINNAMAVLSVYYADKSDFMRKLSDDHFTVPVYSAIISLIVVIGIVFLMKRKSDEVLPLVLSEDNMEEEP